MHKGYAKMKINGKIRNSQVESISMGIQEKPAAVKKDINANAFDASSDIVRFLGALGLCRDARDNQGIVIAKNIRLRCAVLSLVWITLACLCISYRVEFTPRYAHSWKLDVYNEIMHSIIVQMVLAILIWSSVAENESIVIRYYADLTRLDQGLDIRNADHYSQERIILNQRFFSFIFFYFIKIVCEAVLWMMTIGFTDSWSYINDFLASMIQWISQFYYFVRLCVFRSRLVCLNERMETDLKSCEVQVDRNKDRYAEVIKKYKLCYMLLHGQHKIINQIHGLKITVGVVYLVFGVIEVTYYTLALAANKDNSGLLIGMVFEMPDLVLFSALVLYIAQMRHLVEGLQDRLERLLCQSTTLSEMEQRSVLGLVELMHRQPLRFTACDLFTLDNPMLCSLLNFIFTYIIILTQIKNPSEINIF